MCFEEIAERYRAAAASEIGIDPRPRIAALEQEIRNYTDAIAKGLLSDALAQRLKAAEAELARLGSRPHTPSRRRLARCPRSQSSGGARRYCGGWARADR